MMILTLVDVKLIGNIQPDDVETHILIPISKTCWCVSLSKCNLIQTECLNCVNEVDS